MGGKKKYINIFGSFTKPFNWKTNGCLDCYRRQAKFVQLNNDLNKQHKVIVNVICSSHT